MGQVQGSGGLTNRFLPRRLEGRWQGPSGRLGVSCGKRSRGWVGRRSGLCVPIPFPARRLGVGSRQRLEEGEGRPGLGLGTPELHCASFSAREEDPTLQEAPRLPGSHSYPLQAWLWVLLPA